MNTYRYVIPDFEPIVMILFPKLKRKSKLLIGHLGITLRDQDTQLVERIYHPHLLEGHDLSELTTIKHKSISLMEALQSLPNKDLPCILESSPYADIHNSRGEKSAPPAVSRLTPVPILAGLPTDPLLRTPVSISPSHTADTSPDSHTFNRSTPSQTKTPQLPPKEQNSIIDNEYLDSISIDNQSHSTPNDGWEGITEEFILESVADIGFAPISPVLLSSNNSPALRHSDDFNFQTQFVEINNSQLREANSQREDINPQTQEAINSPQKSISEIVSEGNHEVTNMADITMSQLFPTFSITPLDSGAIPSLLQEIKQLKEIHQHTVGKKDLQILTLKELLSTEKRFNQDLIKKDRVTLRKVDSHYRKQFLPIQILEAPSLLPPFEYERFIELNVSEDSSLASSIMSTSYVKSSESFFFIEVV